MAFPLYVFDGDRDHAQTLIPHANKVLHQVRELVRLSGGIHRLVRPIPGGYTEVLKIGDTETVRIFAEATTRREEPADSTLLEILSGVTRGGALVAGNPDVLRDYRPTLQAWLYPLKSDPAKDPAEFNDEPRLAVPPAASLGLPGSSQYEYLKPTMYSGRMAVLVQVLMGYGKLRFQDAPGASDGFKVLYDYRWARTHGIHKGADGNLWLIEISLVNGVLAMRLPLFASTRVGGALHDKLKGSNQDVIRETMARFNGIPSGALFPVGGALTEAIARGDVLRLLEYTALLPFYDNGGPLSTVIGWTFNEDGTEAHNVTQREGDASLEAHHYRIVIDIGALNSERTPENPQVANGTATLQLVSQGLMCRPASQLQTFHVYEPLANAFLSPTFTPVPATSDYNTDATLFVWWEGAQLRKLNYFWLPGTDPGSGAANYGPAVYYPHTEGDTPTTQRIQGSIGSHVRMPVFYVPGDDRRTGLANVSLVNYVTGGSFSPPTRVVSELGAVFGPTLRWYYAVGGATLVSYGDRTYFTSALVPQWCRNALAYFEHVHDGYSQESYDARTMVKPDRYQYDPVVFDVDGNPLPFIYDEEGVIIGRKFRLAEYDMHDHPGYGPQTVLDTGPWQQKDLIFDYLYANANPPWFDPDQIAHSPGRYAQYIADDAANEALEYVTPGPIGSRALVRLYSELGTFDHVAPSSDAADDALAIWDDVATGLEFALTYSKLGEEHLVRSPDIGAAKVRTGPLLDSEPNPTDRNYTFLGHT